jgi:hypothetical protein
MNKKNMYIYYFKGTFENWYGNTTQVDRETVD